MDRAKGTTCRGGPPPSVAVNVCPAPQCMPGTGNENPNQSPRRRRHRRPAESPNVDPHKAQGQQEHQRPNGSTPIGWPPYWPRSPPIGHPQDASVVAAHSTERTSVAKTSASRSHRRSST